MFGQHRFAGCSVLPFSACRATSVEDMKDIYGDRKTSFHIKKSNRSDDDIGSKARFLMVVVEQSFVLSPHKWFYQASCVSCEETRQTELLHLHSLIIQAHALFEPGVADVNTGRMHGCQLHIQHFSPLR